MDSKLFASVFATVFLAEIGDKTQLATMLFAADAREKKLTVFAASAAALVCAAAIGVAAGALVSQVVPPAVLRWVAGLGFVAVGIVVIVRG
ncbi:MAG: TMEM165/GDT1 family protein [Planctomycetota bacterium]